jgi:hypothetical protein
VGKRGVLEVGLAIAVFTALALVAFRPLFYRWNTLPTYERGSTPAMALADRNLNVWIIAWVAHGLVTQPTRLFDGNILYPAPDTLAGSEHMLAHVPFTVPVYLLSGNAAYVLKAMMLESIVLTALAGFLVVRHHTGDAAAGLVAGALLTLSPWRFEPRGVHGGVAAEPQYLGFQFLPLALVALALWVERGRVAAWLGFASAMALQALASFYLGYASFAVAPVYAAVLLLGRAEEPRGHERETPGGAAAAPPAPRGEQRPRGAWRSPWEVDRGRAIGIALALVAAAVVVLPSGIPYLRLRAAGVVPVYDIDFVAAFSTPPWWYASRRGLELVGPLAALAAAALAAVRLARLAGLARPPRARPARAIVGEGAAWALLAAGLILGWGPYQELPGGLRIPLPFALLWKLVPGFSAMRGAGRFVVIVSLACSLLAGYALAGARSRLGRARWLAAALIIGVALFLAAREPVQAVASGVGRDAAPAYQWLAARPAGEPVLELPAKAGEDDLWGLTIESTYMLASTVHWQPILNGYTAYEPPSRYVLAAVAQRLPERDALERLVSLVDLRWVLVHRRLLHPRQRAAFDAPAADLAASGLVERARFGDDVLYEVASGLPHDDRRAALLAPDPTVTLEGSDRAPLVSGCRAGDLAVETPPEVRHSYRKTRLEARISNRSACTWPGLGVGHEGLVMLDYEWRDGDQVVVRGAPGRLSRDVQPGETIDEPLWVLAPRGGRTYTLRVALRQQGEDAPPLATWEGDIHVEPARPLGGS